MRRSSLQTALPGEAAGPVAVPLQPLRLRHPQIFCFLALRFLGGLRHNVTPCCVTMIHALRWT